MNEIFARNILYWGEKAQEKLLSSHIAVFGLGGVGGFCSEALTRSGIGELTLIDFDRVSKTNINDSSALKSWLNSSPLQFVLKRATPITESFDVKSVYPVCYGGLETQETDTIPYVLTKRYALNISSNVKNLSAGIGSVKGVNATNSDSKLYLMGSTAQTTGPDTYSNSEIYATNGTLTTTKTQIGGGKVTMEYNSEDDCLDFVF